MHETEAAAVARAKEGDQEAFRTLVERHSRSLFSLAYRLMGNEQDAEDVVQETFLRAYKQIQRYDGRASFYTWIYRIAANYALDLLRARKTMGRKNDEEADPVLANVAAPDLGADRAVYASQVQTKIESAMAELTPQERTAFVMRHFEGQSIDDIGNVLGIGESATKNSIFRAVQKLRRALEPVVVGAAR